MSAADPGSGHRDQREPAKARPPLGFLVEPDKYADRSSADIVKEGRPYGLVQGPEVVLGMAVAFFAALGDFVDHISRLGTGLENLSEADLERHLRRALTQIEALKEAKELEVKARKELEERLNAVEQDRPESARAAQQARDDADVTRRSLSSALAGTKAELAFAEKALKELRDKQASSKSADDGQNAVLEQEKQGREQQVAKQLDVLQQKMQDSAQQLITESEERKKHQQRVSELETLIEERQAELTSQSIRSSKLEEDLKIKATELSKFVDAATKNSSHETGAAQQDSNELQSRVRELEQLVSEREQEIKDLLTQQEDFADEKKTAAAMVGDLAQQLSDRTAQLEGAENENSSFESKLCDTEAALVKEKFNLKETTQKSEDRAASLKAAQHELKNLQVELDSLKENNAELQSNPPLVQQEGAALLDEESRRELDSLRGSLQKAVDTATELGKSVVLLESELEAKLKLLASTQQENLEKTEDLVVTRDELSMAQTEIKAYVMEFASREDIIHGLWDKNHVLNENVDILTEKNNLLEKQIADLDQQAVSREKQRLTQQAESQDFSALENQIKGQYEKNGALEHVVGELKSKVSQLDATITTREGEISELRAQAVGEGISGSPKDRKLEDLESQVKEMEVLLSEREDELEGAECEISDLRRRLLQQDASVKEMPSSVDITLMADEGKSKMALVEVEQNLSAEQVSLTAEILRAQAKTQDNLAEGSKGGDQSEMKLAALKSEVAAEQGMMEAGIQKARAAAKVAEVKATQKEELVNEVMSTVKGETSKRQKRRKRKQ